jgi:hypothetical protein
MADEKKPKIDLKARLGKTAVGGATPPPAGVGTPMPTPVPVPVPPPTSSAPGAMHGGMPGIPVGPKPAVDHSNPLAAALAQANAPMRSQQPPPQQAQRIEVDEMAVHQARRSAQKQGLVIACVAAVMFLGVGWVVGQAAEANAARVKSRNDAAEMATDVLKARATLDTLATKLEEGRKLLASRKFPDQLAKDLGGLNVNFDGTMLAGRRFSGFSTETTSNLVEFVTQVQALNDRKRILQGLMSRLQKPITEQFSTAPDAVTISQVVAVQKDPAGNPAAFLTTLTTPIKGTQQKLDLPSEFTFANPGGSGNANAPAYRGGDLASKPAAIYVVPGSFNSACPNKDATASAQLAVQMGNAIEDIRGEPAAQGDVVADDKPGLLQRADRLAKALQNVK